MSYKEDILKAFLEFDPELVKQMKYCTHAGKDHNPYHLEGEVFVHTMLTYNQADKDDWMSLIMAICHDIGKVYTREITNKGRISFYGHAEASIQKTIDFVDYLYNQNIIDRFQLIEFINNGLVAMSNHTLYYQNTHKAKYISNGKDSILKSLEKMGKMDSAGSICKDKKITEEEYQEFVAKQSKLEMPTVYVWIGIPGSGKDYIAAKNGFPIVSFDDIRIRTFKEQTKINISELNNDTLYSKAYEHCNKNKIDLMKLMRKEARYYLDKGINVNICNTSLTRKSRRKIINSIGGKYNYVVEQIFTPSNIIFERNINRNSKTIPLNVIKNMMKKMSICTHFEKNINEIKYNYND